MSAESLFSPAGEWDYTVDTNLGNLISEYQLIKNSRPPFIFVEPRIYRNDDYPMGFVLTNLTFWVMNRETENWERLGDKMVPVDELQNELQNYKPKADAERIFHSSSFQRFFNRVKELDVPAHL